MSPPSRVAGLVFRVKKGINKTTKHTLDYTSLSWSCGLSSLTANPKPTCNPFRAPTYPYITLKKKLHPKPRIPNRNLTFLNLQTLNPKPLNPYVTATPKGLYWNHCQTRPPSVPHRGTAWTNKKGRGDPFKGYEGPTGVLYLYM